MGMFDWVVNSYKPLGAQFLNKKLQTKSMESLMSYYWINPNGELFSINTDMCFDYIDNPAFSEDSIGKEWVPPYIMNYNGNHGKISPCYYRGVINLYPEEYNGLYYDWPECNVYFNYGILDCFATIK